MKIYVNLTKTFRKSPGKFEKYWKNCKMLVNITDHCEKNYGKVKKNWKFSFFRDFCQPFHNQSINAIGLTIYIEFFYKSCKAYDIIIAFWESSVCRHRYICFFDDFSHFLYESFCRENLLIYVGKCLKNISQKNLAEKLNFFLIFCFVWNKDKK